MRPLSNLGRLEGRLIFPLLFAKTLRVVSTLAMYDTAQKAGNPFAASASKRAVPTRVPVPKNQVSTILILKLFRTNDQAGKRTVKPSRKVAESQADTVAITASKAAVDHNRAVKRAKKDNTPAILDEIDKLLGTTADEKASRQSKAAEKKANSAAKRLEKKGKEKEKAVDNAVEEDIFSETEVGDGEYNNYIDIDELDSDDDA
jgi:hypothetical protein